MYVGVHARAHEWKPKASLQEFILALHHVALGERTLVISLGGKHL